MHENLSDADEVVYSNVLSHSVDIVVQTSRAYDNHRYALWDYGGHVSGSYPRATVEQLSGGLPNQRIGVTTVGRIRAIGGDVIPTPTDDIPYHATVITGPGGTQELSAVFEIMRNPVWEGS